MSRKKKLAYNAVSSFLYNIITIICGFILPRFYLVYYGSEVNGLVNSITQFLSYINLTDFGVSAVVYASLYGPLANHNDVELSKIFKSASKFYKLIAKILLVYILVLCLIYPYFVKDNFDFFFTVSLILVLSIHSFVQYYFGITNQLLLTADQRAYITFIINTLTLVLNTLVSVYLIKANYAIQIVKLISMLIYLVRPFALVLYVRQKYKINYNIEYNEEPIKQKWNGMAQHIASVVLENTDVIVLTFCATLKDVSVYSIYVMIITGIRRIIMSITSAMEPLIGNILAQNNKELLSNVFASYEWLMHFVTVLLYSITSLTITDFVNIYTHSVNDTDYNQPIFALLITFAFASNNIRTPYNVITLAAGHFKQTQTSCFIEVLINLIVSIGLVYRYGLIGVAIGTILAMIYRTLYLAWYLSKNILFRPLNYFWKLIAIDAMTYFIIYASCNSYKIIDLSYTVWFLNSTKIAIIAIVICIITNILFHRNIIKLCIRYLKYKTG